MIGWVTEAQAAADMTLLDNLSVANHVQIKNDLRWRRLYRRAQRNINFMNPVGVVVAQAHQTYPCHYCGVILPEEFIEVDHRQPQRHPGVAVLKVIRAVNAAYTTAAATGTKAGQVANINAAPSVGPFPLSLAQTMALAALNPIPVNGWDWVTAWQGNAGAMNVNKTARYTITAAGQTFLSLCSMLWGLTRVRAAVPEQPPQPGPRLSGVQRGGRQGVHGPRASVAGSASLGLPPGGTGGDPIGPPRPERPTPSRASSLPGCYSRRNAVPLPPESVPSPSRVRFFVDFRIYR